MSRKLIALFFVIGWLTTFSFAQSKPEKSPVAPAPNGLALEVNSLQEKSPFHQFIADSAADARWVWYSKFKWVEGFENSTDRLPVKAVKFVAHLEKTAVKVSVTVFTGVKFFENEETVGVYSMRESERLTVKELRNFGVEPFEIAVVRLSPTVSVLPSFKNKTVSLQLIGIEPVFSTIPSYKIKLLNNSEKTVAGFAFITTLNDRKQLSAMPSNIHDESLIVAGGEFEKTIPNVTDGWNPLNGKLLAERFDHVFVITSVVFTDGSYEGDFHAAVRFRAAAAGKKRQLKQIVALIEDFENRNTKLEFNNLAERALKLEVNADETELDNLIRDFPGLNGEAKSGLRNTIEIDSDRVKREFIRSLEMQIRESSPDALALWLTQTKNEYQNWIKRLR